MKRKITRSINILRKINKDRQILKAQKKEDSKPKTNTVKNTQKHEESKVEVVKYTNIEVEYKGYEFSACVEGGTLTEDEYIYLIDCLERERPDRICELGAGQSTKVFRHYCEKYDKTFYSIEHDEKYRTVDSVMFPMVENTTVLIGKEEFGTCNKYDGFEGWLSHQRKFDFVLIDGPVGSGFRESYDYSRVQLLSFIILNKINDGATVMYHDSERNNAKPTLNKFEELLSNANIGFTKIVLHMNEKRELTIYKINKVK